MVNVFVGQNTVSTTGSGTVDLTSPDDSVTPDASMHIVTGNDTLNAAANRARIGVGFSDGTNEYTSTIGDNNNTGTTTSSKGQYADALALVTAGTQSNDGRHTHNSFISGGERLNDIDAFTDTFLCNSIFFEDCNTSVLQATLSGSVDTAVNIDPGFAWDFVILTNTADTTGLSNNADMSIGFYNQSDDTQSCLVYNSDNGDTSADVATHISTIYAGASISDGVGEIVYGIDVSAGAGTSCDLTTRIAGGSSHLVNCLFIGFTAAEESQIIEWSTPTTTGDSAISGVNFSPEALIHLISYCPSYDTAEADSDGGSWGISIETADSQYCFAYSNEFNTGGNTNSQSFTADTSIRVPVDSGSESTTTSLRASLTSIDSNGWTHNWVNRDSATARRCITLAIGEDLTTSTGLNFRKGLFV